MIRSWPQETERVGVQLQQVTAGLGDLRNLGAVLEGVGSYGPGSVHTQGMQAIETALSGYAGLPDVVWTKCKATCSRHIAERMASALSLSLQSGLQLLDSQGLHSMSKIASGMTFIAQTCRVTTHALYSVT